MHAFSRLIARTRKMLIQWLSASLNSIEEDLEKVELDIRIVEATEKAILDFEHNHLHLISLYNHYSSL